MKPGERIADDLLARPVNGLNLVPGTLGDQLGQELSLLVFLRHFGCIFCRETLADMRAVAESDARFPRPLFFFQGSATEGRAFLRRYWPSLRAVADPEAEIYEAFGIARGHVVQMLRPAVWSARSRAEAKGHRNGERSGDIWRMPGVYLARGPEIVWAHEYRHVADHPDYGVICELAAEAS
ncbi:MAG: SelL-related redox protein [Myxococcota bacterium]